MTGKKEGLIGDDDGDNDDNDENSCHYYQATHLAI